MEGNSYITYKGKLVNCNIILRDNVGADDSCCSESEPLFISREDGTLVANLEEYTVLPNEEYGDIIDAMWHFHNCTYEFDVPYKQCPECKKYRHVANKHNMRKARTSRR